MTARDAKSLAGLSMVVMVHHYFIGNVNSKVVTIQPLFFVIILLITIDF